MNDEEFVDRRKPLTDSELAQIKEQLLESIYADIGKNVVKKFLWIGGTILAAFLTWLTTRGHITITDK